MNSRGWRAALIAGSLCLGGMGSAWSADIRIINNDGASEGLNDPRTVQPVGGNPGTTLGAQRRNALQFAADLLGAKVSSNVPILVDAEFNPQQCSPGNATLAAAGATTLVADFPNGRPDTFYPVALANALAGRDLDPGSDIGATFNSSIDNNLLCLTGINWYYGFDDNPPGNDLNFISTAAHELVHGLGFATFTNLTTGQFVQGTPDIYAVFIRDLIMGANWPALTAPQRAASASNDGNLVWDGPSAISRGAPTLTDGVNQGRIQLFAPFPMQGGSSVSHWDTDVTPNALMEPFDTDDVLVTQGIGLSACLLQDIGWRLMGSTLCPDGSPASRDGGAPDGETTVEEGDPPAPSGSDGSSNGGSDPLSNDSSGGGGGGCSLGDGSPDPMLALLVLLAVARLRRKRG